MKIIVCVKQVPDTTGKVALNPDGTLDRAKMKVIINPDDLNAVEAALSLKDQLGCRVCVITMGPPAAEKMLRELMAMGCDDSVLVCGPEFKGSDTFATSAILAAAIEKIGLDDDDMVFCGQRAIDGDTAQVGPELAEKLGIAQATYAAGLEMKDGTTFVKRALEGAYETVSLKAPCLVTCTKELNTPRYMSVEGIFETYKKPMMVLGFKELSENPAITPDSIGLAGSPTSILSTFAPPEKPAGRMLDGNGMETCRQLAGILSGRHVL